MGFQGITQHGKFAWSGSEKAVEEVINLGGIDGEQGKAGMEFLSVNHPTFFPVHSSAQDRPSGGNHASPRRCQGLEGCPHRGVAGPDRLPGVLSDSR